MWQRETFKKIKQIPREEHVLAGDGRCAGCGGLEALRLAAKVLGDQVVYVNAAGCFTMLAAYPLAHSRDRGCIRPWDRRRPVHRAFRDALDMLIAKGRLPKSEGI